MIQFDLPKEKSAIIKVIGVGGGGGNAVNHMYSQMIDGVNFIICNTDAQAIAQSKVPNKIQLGPHLTQGLGAGANPDIGRQATEESLEEIRQILEVNTKMAFITVGMGGGTGTGGAPIIAKICKDLDILTVGIVTTPFAYEGKRRQQQAEEGIKNLKQYVDTLLVISNDKLRHQFGNLKMREAFAKADNVLATAARCITDVINSTGQINVDFADVCTVMRNGGVAILGSAIASGEHRALKAIEEAISSPLLNDNDIRGAKWLLININSAEGEHEFTMDEVEVIQNYLLTQAGEDTDVILGMGYDSDLGENIGITLIATGFQHKDPFTKQDIRKAKPKEEKIIMILGKEEEKNEVEELKPVIEDKIVKPDPLAPVLIEEIPVSESPMPSMNDLITSKKEEEDHPIVYWDLIPESKPEAESYPQNEIKAVDKMFIAESKEEIYSNEIFLTLDLQNNSETSEINDKENVSRIVTASGGYLARPSNIYAESKAEESTSKPSAEEPVPSNSGTKEEEELFDLQMRIVERDDIKAVDMPLAHQTHPVINGEPLFPTSEETHIGNEDEEQNRRAAERLKKLRNLSFNVNAADPNNEFETVPAYIRRNMELYNNGTVAENFYSNYEVKTDDNNKSQITTINTFLEGKKPD